MMDFVYGNIRSKTSPPLKVSFEEHKIIEGETVTKVEVENSSMVDHIGKEKCTHTFSGRKSK